MAIKIDQDLASESVILSELRCLDLTGLADSSLSCLLGILSPGSHQLDVRLKPSGKRQNQRTVQAFLRRVDVGHLYLSYPQTWDSNHDPSISLRPYLSRTPNLRVLVLDLTSDEDLSKIDVLATVHSAQTCPLLTTLCIIGHHFSETGVDQLKQIVEAQSSLRQLVFVNSEIKVYLDTVEEEEMYKERVNAWLAERVREVLWKQVPCFDEDRVAEHVERVLARK
ncbi:hypothetical protein FRC07_011344 [Ceratobasidium sp. 392]|nr:hypothetical protein FRC07_011344 [Ceratobasidium sp. 392]